ncbi:hypothetical protein DN402_24885 [Streptomyces sp. SW4]|nr:hypothetical protein DN402_24885 [Streptomyces sp. SW4]
MTRPDAAARAMMSAMSSVDAVEDLIDAHGCGTRTARDLSHAASHVRSIRFAFRLIPEDEP